MFNAATLDPTANRAVISIHGAREHNLKNLSLVIPRGQFVVITGVSGSGKSTLAFDLLFAEGQRRFLDSMNTYARQFVEQLSRPEVDLITGIPPTVSIEQRTTRGGGKSTVATVTEVYHFLRLLFARLGTQHCPDCHLPVEAQTRDQLGAHLASESRKRGDLLLLAPMVKNRKGFHTDVAEWASQHGYKQIRADGKTYDTSKPFRLDRFREHDVEISVGVLEFGVPPSGGKARPKFNRGEQSILLPVEAGTPHKTPQQLIDQALKLGQGTLFALDPHGAVTIHSTERACPRCSRSFEPLDPKMFSYNSSQGWCPNCRGFGELFYLPDVDRGANADAIEESWWSWQEGKREICPACRGARLNPVARAVRLNLGQASRLSRIFQDAAQAQSRPTTNQRRSVVRERRDACPTIDDFSSLSVSDAFDLFRHLKYKGRAAQIARDILPEIRERLRFLAEVGLGYLQLGRGVTTLSGGEAQRIRLAAQLGSNLSGVLYVLDEPTIGLHARDNEQLLTALHTLQSRGNSLVVVEHDEATMRHADYIIDLGPGAGVHGGELVAGGTLAELLKHPDSTTGQCLRAQAAKTYPARGQRRTVHLECGDLSPLSPVGDWSPTKRRARQVAARKSADKSAHSKATPHSGWLTLRYAAANNLKDLTVRFPLNRLVLVTGVSGSGKSTLVRECLLPAVAEALKSKSRSTHHVSRSNASTLQPFNPSTPPLLTGFDSLKAVYEVDQSPIGRTPRSTPATYVGFFDDIRALFAQTPEARMRGYTASRFSFNSAQGRCPECEGAGTIKLEMNFLPPAFVRCETCGGTRFNRETLDLRYREKNIAQVLDLSVEEAIEFFSSFPRIQRPLQALHDTGLDYLKLGQTSPTLSGGEAQRVKLVTHLLTGLKEVRGERAEVRAAAASTSHLAPRTSHLRANLFILEEPTIGLHMADVRRLVEVLQRLVDAGHSVLVIEHNLDLIAEADWVIDLGPEGGAGGGRIVVEGTPEEVARHKNSHTGRFLRRLVLR
ncbi:MAG TPA: excinuclease ABC subunit A [Verrucomicrobiae bacterium]